MKITDIIIKKRDGYELNYEELQFVVNGYIKGEIPDYQISAWLMAVYFQGMTDEETYNLTMIMKDTGCFVDFKNPDGIFVDKHSTGGIGDKTTMIVAPIVAACGLKIGKMSGKSLGYAGGTVDKLDSIKGYKTDLEIESFIHNVNQIGISLIGQSKELVVGDKYIYALRDCTGTVESIPLIASSIMSKKLAINNSCIVLDVKYGDGAFMHTESDAEALAKQMIQIGKRAGRKIAVILSESKEPLGYCVGNSLEVIEAMSLLNGEKIDDLYFICVQLATVLLTLANGKTYGENQALVEQVIADKKAINKFRELLQYQGVSPLDIKNGTMLCSALYSAEIRSNKSGYINRIKSEICGKFSMELGAGRNMVTDEIDYTAGIRLHKKSGEKVQQGDLLATLYSSNNEKLEMAVASFMDVYEIESENLFVSPKTRIIW